MSTCPDSDLYSAWVDGEVPSPWKEKLEAHIKNCPNCKKRSERYRSLHSLISSTHPALSETQMELSFSRLCAKRDALVVREGPGTVRHYPVWTHTSVRLPLPALAAMLVAAVFLPVWLTIRESSSAGNQGQTYAILPTVQQAGTGGMRAISTSTPVYSPDLPFNAISDNMIDANNQQYFTMLSFARQFATDKKLFANGEIIIIKLPALTRFNTTSEKLFKDERPLGQAAGFYK